MKKLVSSILTFSSLMLVAGIVIAQVSDAPQTPFKLATFEADGQVRLGILVDDRLLDLNQANAYVVREAGVPSMELPGDMRALIEQSDRTKPRLFQIANYLEGKTDGLDFGFDPNQVAFKAPVKYPWNLMAAAANYRAHAAEMGNEREVDPDRDAPYLFAKSPRSSIADPGQPFVIPPGRKNIDWEGEFVAVIASPTTRVGVDEVMDHVFGFTIMYDVSDRAPQYRETEGYGVDWFAGKSRDGAAPMGPYIVPREFLDHRNLRIVTRLNDRVVQDSNTSYMIHDTEHLIAFVSSIMTLCPGDMIATGTPDGVGQGRQPPEYVGAGDVVSIEIEGIGTLVTPIK